MKILVACEFSGCVTHAFRKLGHSAYSCDLLPSESDETDSLGLPVHFRRNVNSMLTRGWDMLIAFPPCTFLTNSGIRWLYEKGRRWNADGSENPIDEERWAQMEYAAAFFNSLKNAPIPVRCIENPRMHPYAQRLCGLPTQYIQPWEHGHGEIKGTGLHLIGLPPLVPTNIVDGRLPRVHHASPGPERWKERSRTLPGIAKAMAEQWGKIDNPMIARCS